MSSERVFGLDVLRAVAILSVVVAHGHTLIAGVVSPFYLAFFPDGVTMFFVLSGFLIGSILLRALDRDEFGPATVAIFWFRRWSRTLPAYFVVLGFLMVASWTKWVPNRADRILAFATFTQNIAWPHPEFFGEAWSLAVEEWFYLVMPLLFLALVGCRADTKRSMVLLISVVVIVAVTAFRAYRVIHLAPMSLEFWDITLRKQVATRADSLMFGVLAAYVYLYYRSAWDRRRRVLAAIGVVLLAVDLVAASNVAYMQWLALTVPAVGAALVLPQLSAWRSGGYGIAARMTTFFSVTSYSMYLLHRSPIRDMILPNLVESLSGYCRSCGTAPAVQYLLFWTLTLVLSWLLFRYLESPVLAWRDRRTNAAMHSPPVHLWGLEVPPVTSSTGSAPPLPPPAGPS